MKKIIILTDGHLPVPAVQGGAIPTLMDSLINQNEVEKQIELTYVSLYHREAFEKSKTIKNTEFIFLKHLGIIKILDLMLTNISKFFRHNMSDIFWKLYIIEKCKKLLESKKYDAVVIENQGFLTKIFEKNTLLDKYESKIFYHLHNDIPESVSEKVVSHLQYILISNYLRKNIDLRYPDNNFKCFILKNGINTDCCKFSLSEDQRIAMRKSLGILPTDRVLCFVGRIDPTKGVLELLKAFSKIEKNDFKLMIIGATEFANNLESEFEQQVTKIGHELGSRVIMTGYIKHADIWKYYQCADIVVLPSIWEEPAGLTIIEAMANGIPVITTNAGGIPEYMNLQYGVILERNLELIDSIYDSILDMCSNISIWKERCLGAPNYVEKNFSEEIFYKNFCKIINGDLK